MATRDGARQIMAARVNRAFAGAAARVKELLRVRHRTNDIGRHNELTVRQAAVPVCTSGILQT